MQHSHALQSRWIHPATLSEIHGGGVTERHDFRTVQDKPHANRHAWCATVIVQNIRGLFVWSYAMIHRFRRFSKIQPSRKHNWSSISSKCVIQTKQHVRAIVCNSVCMHFHTKANNSCAQRPQGVFAAGTMGMTKHFPLMLRCRDLSCNPLHSVLHISVNSNTHLYNRTRITTSEYRLLCNGVMPDADRDSLRY